MYLKLSFLNDEQHKPEFFGKIFSGSCLARPMKGETLVSITGEKYFVKDIFVSTVEIEQSDQKNDVVVYEYQLEKLEKKSTIVEIA